MCVYVCMHACMYVYVYLFIYAHTWTQKVRTNNGPNTSNRAQKSIMLHTLGAQLYMYVYIYIDIYTIIYAYTYQQICLSISRYVSTSRTNCQHHFAVPLRYDTTPWLFSESGTIVVVTLEAPSAQTNSGFIPLVPMFGHSIL